jgi:hypothetical protein
MPNVSLESEDEIKRALHDIINNPRNPENQGKFEEITGVLSYLGSVDEETTELFTKARAAIEAALAAARGPDWGSVTAPPTQEFPEIRF